MVYPANTLRHPRRETGKIAPVSSSIWRVCEWGTGLLWASTAIFRPASHDPFNAPEAQTTGPERRCVARGSSADPHSGPPRSLSVPVRFFATHAYLRLFPKLPPNAVHQNENSQEETATAKPRPRSMPCQWLIFLPEIADLSIGSSRIPSSIRKMETSLDNVAVQSNIGMSANLLSPESIMSLSKTILGTPTAPGSFARRRRVRTLGGDGKAILRD